MLISISIQTLSQILWWLKKRITDSGCHEIDDEDEIPTCFSPIFQIVYDSCNSILETIVAVAQLDSNVHRCGFDKWQLMPKFSRGNEFNRIEH